MSNKMLLSVLVLVGNLALVASDAYGNYPEAYPFASDEPDYLVLPDTGMPDFTFDDNDSGGYYLYGAIKQTMDNQDGPLFVGLGNSVDHFFFAEMLGNGFFGVRFFEYDLQTWNCTASGVYVEQDMYPGVQNGEDVSCAAGGCCSDYIGKIMFGTELQTRQDQFSDFVSANGCATMDEPTYCVTGDNWHWLCFENYITRDERLIIKPCYDNFVKHQLTCPVIKSAGTNSYLEALGPCEPQPYIDALTPLESMVIYGIEFATFDRVCHPYSYYYPDAEGGNGDDSAAFVWSAGAVAAAMMSVV